MTLGTLALFRGVGYIILGSASVNEFPDALTDFGIRQRAGHAHPMDDRAVSRCLRRSSQSSCSTRRRPTNLCDRRQSRHGAATPASHVRRLRFWLFVVSGIVCAVAGIVLTARLANARANNALGFELDVITIALLGGVSVFGGRGKLTGVLWALVLVAIVRNVLGLNQIGGDAQGIVIGLLLIVSLLLSNTVERFLSSSGSQAPPSGEGSSAIRRGNLARDGLSIGMRREEVQPREETK